ncbi:ABC transporter ATP-binding protein [Aquirufa sp.]|jgi:ABC-2 type transport system ATP-binding protein|uniref:ABC transporter ATP-binding protein n=1 Tax=Aquirufa sp. TaxID=2676249 RepID=UPI0037BE6BD4
MPIFVSNLGKKYGQQWAVQGLNFQAQPGEIIGFLGPNGAGKSSTLKMLVGLLPPTEGSAQIQGIDIQSNTLALKKQIGYLAENNPIYPEMYVKEFLEIIGKLHGYTNKNCQKRIQEVVELVGLSREQSKKIGELSKGYQQRVGIAQAIFHNPDILILDEPTSGLDPNQMEEIRQLILSLKSNKTILFSSHLLSEVESICDRILLINQGKLMADCSISEAKAYPGGLTSFFQDKTK